MMLCDEYRVKLQARTCTRPRAKDCQRAQRRTVGRARQRKSGIVVCQTQLEVLVVQPSALGVLIALVREAQDWHR